MYPGRTGEGGLELTAEGLAAAPHLLGRLWKWRNEQQPGMPRLQNTDGHELRLQQATFAVGDARALCEHLAAKPDVEADDDSNDAWVWFRRQREERTLLAHLRLLGDELLVQVNSDARLAAVRKWLEAIPAVTFVRTRVQELDDVPRDDSLRAGPRAEDADVPALREHMHRRYMAWLDEHVPALGGKTPREACRTKAGRRKVEQLLRTWPDSVGLGSIRVPREEMRRELGLGDG